MLPDGSSQQIRRIQIKTSRMVTSAFAGEYQSAFRGRGIEFGEVREYQPGDDIRFIDWNVTARMRRPFVKTFVEERELTVMLLLDVSPSMMFGTKGSRKVDTALEVCSLLSSAAMKSNDRVGLLMFTDRVEAFLPPGKGIRYLLRIVREGVQAVPGGRGTDITTALDHLNNYVKRRTVTFLFSDFYVPEHRRALAVASKRHDLVAVTILDPAELELADIGLACFADAESGRRFIVDTSSHDVRTQYERDARERLADKSRLFRSLDVDHLDLRTDQPYLKKLIRFFRLRTRRLQR